MSFPVAPGIGLCGWFDVGGSGTETSLIERWSTACLLPHPLNVELLIPPKPPSACRPANAVVYPRVVLLPTLTEPWSKISVNGADIERRGGVRAPRRAVIDALLPAFVMGEIIGEEDRALTRGITLDRYDIGRNFIILMLLLLIIVLFSYYQGWPVFALIYWLLWSWKIFFQTHFKNIFFQRCHLLAYHIKISNLAKYQRVKKKKQSYSMADII